MKRLEDCHSDQDLFTQLDSELHLALARCSRIPLLTRDKILAYDAEYRAIFEALFGHGTQVAVELIRKHLEQARDDRVGAKDCWTSRGGVKDRNWAASHSASCIRNYLRHRTF